MIAPLEKWAISKKASHRILYTRVRENQNRLWRIIDWLPLLAGTTARDC
jgi:hypothetical protein